jgi:hypothetical protein
MKIATLFAAVALTCGVALAAEPPAAPSATPIKHTSLKACNKQADAKKLAGAARTEFLKDCHGRKPS